MNPVESASTREVILGTSERMFAEQGYQAVSVRAITRECNMNPAAVHYHFGSKQAVLDEIFARRCGPINGERLKLLAQCREGPDRPPLVEQILEAYLRPSLIWDGDPEGARNFLRLRAKLAHEQAGLIAELIARHFDDVSQKFIQALADALPELPREYLYWRVHFLHAAQYYTLINPGRIRHLSGGSCDPSNADEALHQMVSFFAGGLRQPAATLAPATGLDAL